ncbi:hypothetical protein [Synechococcus sp. PCC 6312]|uniref:hypothetical protein n=1 Tax=Synechococcus sp. (strain ATCC 27167 / PCC 6312) TaxID=195253 RepID=UPI00029EFDF8|nr:hypothetical protein [Synechococcus sp. PCC 6312]AFY59595.1 hypothetical protein Syn6312_0363 [Synechococcus sp. PCC 6312]
MNINSLYVSPSLRFWLTLILVVWALGALGLGWLVKSFVILLVILAVTPILIVIGLRFWLRQNLIQAPCPVCGFEFASLVNSKTRCPNCGEAVDVENRQFVRQTPPGTIDVAAVEVRSQALED